MLKGIPRECISPLSGNNEAGLSIGYERNGQHLAFCRIKGIKSRLNSSEHIKLLVCFPSLSVPPSACLPQPWRSQKQQIQWGKTKGEKYEEIKQMLSLGFIVLWLGEDFTWVRFSNFDLTELNYLRGSC